MSSTMNATRFNDQINGRIVGFIFVGVVDDFVGREWAPKRAFDDAAVGGVRGAVTHDN